MTPGAPGAPTVSGGIAERSVLVIGYGNTLRRDDGAGARVAALLAADPRFDGVEVLTAYQLTPELAVDIGAVSLVIFIDADVAADPGTIAVRSIDAAAPRSDTEALRSDAAARAEPGVSSHHVGAGELVALAEELTGHRPKAVTVGIGVVDLELGEGLSAPVEAVLPRVVEAVVSLAHAHRSA